MNTKKNGNYGKLIAFFLVAVILVGTFGFAAEGWQSTSQNESDSGKVDDDSDKADENKDDENKEPEIYIPEFVSSLSGLEVTESVSRQRPVGFVMDSSSPLYGISGAEVVVELPTENGQTRLVAFTTSTRELGKIGSLAPTRGYMSNIAKYFGAVLVSAGCDDTIEYESLDLSASHFDTTQNSGYHYTEYTHFVYTNGALIGAGLANTNIGTALNARQQLPFSFAEFGSDKILGSISARSVVLPFSQSSESELYYSEEDGKYSFSKGGVTKTDMLSDKYLAYDNVFVLFADTVTYESASGSEMIMNTTSSGTGYYISAGYATAIKWEANSLGNMTFFTESGEKLTVNRGRSYIGFLKSSLAASFKFS
ncbi:MAG: DUF3048 C-terminal domain-containing protein [Clostridia bacterium]|nr:DUF3048 C-terminal domain-containing protein [Clostridia bacterium]